MVADAPIYRHFYVGREIPADYCLVNCCALCAHFWHDSVAGSFCTRNREWTGTNLVWRAGHRVSPGGWCHAFELHRFVLYRYACETSYQIIEEVAHDG